MQKNATCVLMFSGGRDSTIAAIRLARQFRSLVLITIISEHLVGIQKVHQRIVQLKKLLPADAEWIQVVQPPLPSLDTLTNATCLPCQRAYVATGAIWAKRTGIADLALGYATYQSAWPEQTPYATERLRVLLDSLGIRLHLPVYDLASKREAEAELSSCGLPNESFEQKCLKQESNVEMPPEALRKEVDLWERSTVEIIKADSAVLSPISRKKLSEM